MLNSTPYNSAANLYSNHNQSPIIGGLSVADSISPLPFYNNSQIGDAVLQQLAKSMNYYNHGNPPLKDESDLTLNNNALPTLPRKRPRESSMATTSLINRNNSNGCNNCSLISVPTGKVSGRCPDGAFSFLGKHLSLQKMQQQLETDRLISLHMEKVRVEMEERRRKQSTRMIQAIQESVTRKLKDKEEQIEKIGKMNWSLEERIKSLYVDNQIWRDLAQTNQATANALRSNLEQVLSQANSKAVNGRRVYFGACTHASATNDAESCCGSSGDCCEDNGEEVDGGRILRWRMVARTSGGGDKKEVTAAKEEEERRKRLCRRCGAAGSSVLLLPCRHLCLCSACGPAVETCPICNSSKNASVHVNLC